MGWSCTGAVVRGAQARADGDLWGSGGLHTGQEAHPEYVCEAVTVGASLVIVCHLILRHGSYLGVGTGRGHFPQALLPRHDLAAFGDNAGKERHAEDLKQTTQLRRRVSDARSDLYCRDYAEYRRTS